jgi:hypothetical protein
MKEEKYLTRRTCGSVTGAAWSGSNVMYMPAPSLARQHTLWSIPPPAVPTHLSASIHNLATVVLPRRCPARCAKAMQLATTRAEDEERPAEGGMLPCIIRHAPSSR